MHRTQQWLIAIVCLFLPTVAAAVSLEQMDVSVQDGTVRAAMIAHLQAEPAQVRSALTSFERLEQLNPSIQSSEVVARQGESMRVRTKVRQCLGIFCREMTRTEAVRVGKHTIRARMVPDASDFRSGRTLWLITASDRGTRLEVRIQLTPEDPPPGLLDGALANNLREQLRATLDRLERTETVPTRAAIGH